MAYIGRNPAIGTQKVLDSLESQFNGVLTTFDLRYNTNTIYPTIASALIVSLGGVLQEPGSAYNVASDQITFATAPPTGTDCWILLYSEFGGVAGATTNLTVGNNLAVQGATDLDGDIDIDAGQITYTASSNIAKFADDAKLIFGGGDDLKIYHDSTFNNGVIQETGSGNLLIGGKNINFRDAGLGDTYAMFRDNSTNTSVELYYDSSKKFETTSTGATVTGTALATALSTGASGTGINISTNTISGPATLTIDPAAVGDNTGTVIIAGDFQVDGTTTTINSTTLTVDDKNIVLASGAVNSAAANDAGITIDGASATLLYKSTPDAWSFNKNVGIGAANNTSYDINARNLLLASDGNTGMTIRSAGSTPFAMIHFADGTTGQAQQRAGRILYQHDGDNLSLHTANEERLRITGDGDIRARRDRSNTAGDVALSIQPGDSTIHYGFRIDSANNNLNLDRVGAGNLTTFRNDGLISAKALHITDNLTPTSGRGVEIFAASAGVGQISSFNRTGGSWDELRIKGSEVAIYTGTTNSESLCITSGGNVRVPDNGKFTAGDGDDLQIYHDGSNSYINEAGTGQLRILSNRTHIKNAANSLTLAEFTTSDNSVILYKGGSAKLQTTTTGAKVTGALEVTQEYPTIRPTIDLNFAATKTLDRRITFTRDSIGTYVDELGVIRYASNNVPRFDHDPETGESLGLLIEEPRTNLVEYGDFTTGWSEFGGAATSTTETAAPDGTFTATKITSKGDQSTAGIYDAINYSANTTYTHTMWLKAGTITIAGITVNSGGKWASSNYPYITVNLSTGAVTASGGVSAKATAYPNGWYRLEATGTFGGNTQVDAIWVHSQTGSSMSGDTTSYYYVWGPQAEQGSFATSYIPTTGTTATRAADIATITGTNFTDFYNKDEGTLFVNYKLDKANYLYSPAGVELVAFKADNNSGRYSVRVVSNTSSPQLDAHGIDDGAAQFDVAGIDLSEGLKDYFVAKAFKLNDMATSFNGAAPQTDTSVTVVEWDKLLIGTAPKRAHYKSIKYYPKRLPNAQLQGLTQQ